VTKILSVDSLMLITGAINLFFVVLIDNRLYKFCPIFLSLVFESLRKFSLHESNVLFGKVGLVTFLQEAPNNLVVSVNFISKIFACGNAIAIRKNDSSVTSNFYKFFYSLELFWHSFSSCRHNKESFVEIFNCN
jgi:hypothetical protein